MRELNIDAKYNQAIRPEIGARLRVLLREQPDVPTRLRENLAGPVETRYWDPDKWHRRPFFACGPFLKEQTSRFELKRKHKRRRMYPRRGGACGVPRRRRLPHLPSGVVLQFTAYALLGKCRMG
jgi:hypothetical protein